MSTLFNTRYYRVTKLFCSVAGLWPDQPQHIKKILQSLNMLLLLSYYIPQFRVLYQVWGKDIDRICMCIPPILTILACIAKDTAPIVFESEMKELLRDIEEEWRIPPKREEYKILVNYTSKSRRLCIAYARMLFYGVICFNFIPTISPMLDIVLPRNETRAISFPYDLDYGFDLQTYWYWSWLHVSITGMVVIINFIAADLLYFTLTIHACCLFAIAKYKLEHVADWIKKRTAQSFETRKYNTDVLYQCEEKRQELQKEAAVMRECILSHKRAIRFAQLLHCIYAWALFSATSLSIIGISISSVQLVSKLSSQWADMMLSIIYIILELFHLFFQTLMAQYILDQSLNVHESAYSSSWYNMPIKVQRNVILIILRSHAPCTLMAGGFYTLSLESFCTILQTSMSYFTVLASFR